MGVKVGVVCVKPVREEYIYYIYHGGLRAVRALVMWMGPVMWMGKAMCFGGGGGGEMRLPAKHDNHERRSLSRPE